VPWRKGEKRCQAPWGTPRLTWDPVGRLVDVVKTDGGDVTHLQHVYDASNSRVIRLDLETTEVIEQATLYISGGYEIRNAGIVDLPGDPSDRTYTGGEETKFVFDGPNRLARIADLIGVRVLADGE
jgi:hypothetical protein